MNLGETDRVAALSGLGHDPLLRDLFTPLTLGASTWITDPASDDPASLVRGLRRGGVTVLHLTPAMLQLLEIGAVAGGGGLAALRLAAFGGEPLVAGGIQRLRRLAPSAACVNFYGATETPQAMAWHRCTADDEAAAPESPVPLGVGVDDAQLILLSPRGRRLAGVGELGEVCIRSPRLASGYVGDPDATSSRFIANPFTGVPGDRLYRTGDLGRYRPDGRVEFAGRRDDQVKVRGHRVEPGDVSAALRGHPAVRDAVTIPVTGDDGEIDLHAWVASDAADVDELRAFAAARLPAFMVPRAIARLDALPLTPNGKVDRRRLPAIDTAKRPSSAPMRAPTTPTETRLAGLFAGVLGCADIGIDDDFFARGGHSLKAAQLAARVRDALGVELPLKAIFDSPTVAALADRIDRGNAPGAADEPLVPVARGGGLPLSSTQRRLWFLEQIEPGSGAYHVGGGVRLHGSLDAHALRRALHALAGRHEVLRTRIVTRDAEPVQVIDPQPAPAFDMTHAGDMTPGDLAAAVTGFIRAPFDLERGPVLRARLWRISPDEHALAIALHHVAADGWSMGVLMRDLTRLYSAAVAGEPDGLPALPVQFADFAAWQAKLLDSPRGRAQLDGWIRRLTDTPVLDLPTDRTRPPRSQRRGGVVTATIDADLAQSLRHLGAQHGATMFMTLLAAFQWLLARGSGQTDFAVGTPVANRPATELENMVGPFVNTLVLRTDLAGVTSFTDLLGRVRATVLEALASSHVPFERLVNGLKLPRDVAQTPLFRVMFVLQNTPREDVGMAGLRASPLDAGEPAAKYDLTLSVFDRGEAPVAAFEYASDLFDRATIERMAGHYMALLRAVARAPDAPLSGIRYMGEPERRRVLVEWNDTDRPYPRGLLLHQLFERQARETPDATAVIFGDQAWTYRRLDERANRLAHHLRGLGIGPDGLVAICLERSPAMPLAMLAVLKAGGAWVPIEPGYPPARMAAVVDDARPIAIVTDSESAPRLPTDTAAPVVCLDRDRAVIDGHPAEPPDTGVHAEHLAYVIYTSGSTGVPKGAMIPHRAIVNRLLALHDDHRLEPGQRVLQRAPFAFDVSVWEIFWPLTRGAAVVLAEPGGHRDPGYLARVIDEQAVTHIDFVPSMLAAFLDAAPASAGTGLRFISIGGEALPWDLADRALARWPQAELFNYYGPAETAVEVTWHRCGGGLRAAGALVPLGRPIANNRVYILDGDLQPVPIGAAGELCVGGAQVGRGYLNRPELSAQRFVPDPFAPQRGESPGRLYRTGDLARRLADGTIAFLGRMDQQVKVRGNRVELGEIESALGMHPAVAAAVVVAQSGPGGTRLAAYLQPRGEDRPPVSVLRPFLQQRVPDYMIPAAVTWLNAFPTTATGKIDRKALPAPVFEAADLASFAEPQTDAERTLASIWREVLGVRQVGIHDNFFDLGGDSILSIQIVARARRNGLHLTPRQVFEHQTVASLALATDESAHAAAADPGPVVGDIGPTPISVRFFEEAHHEPHHYNQSVMLTVPADLAPEHLQGALRRIVEHHDALRMRVEGGRMWIAAPQAAPPMFERFDLSRLKEHQQAPRIEKLAARLQASLRFEGPMARAAWFDLGPNRPGRLLLIIHHLAVDGVSWRIVLEDLAVACTALHDNGEPALPPRTASIRQWARALGDAACGEAAMAELAFWTRPDHSEPFELPGAAEGRRLDDSRRHVEVLGEATTESLLRSLPRVLQAGIEEALLATLARVLGEATGAGLVRLDLEGHGRDIELPEPLDVSRTVGWFTSMYPVTIRLPRTRDPRDLLRDIRDQFRDVPRRGVGFGLLRYLNPETAPVLKGLPRAPVLLNYLGQFDGVSRGAGLFSPADESTGPARSRLGRREHALEINASVGGGRLRIAWGYAAGMNGSLDVPRLARRQAALLDELAAAADQTRGLVADAQVDLADLATGDLAALADLLDDPEPDHDPSPPRGTPLP